MTSSCRICLSPNTSKDVSALPIDLQVESSVQDVLRFCLSIEMTEDTSNYNRLCSSCHSSIVCFYTFKELALKSDSYLRSLKCSQDNELDKEVFVGGNDDVKLEFGEVLVKEEDLYDVDVVSQDEPDVLQEYAVVIKEEPPDESNPRAHKPNPYTKKLPCQICGCLLTNMMFLDRHILRIHHKERQFFCGDCSAGFYLKEALEMHTRREHLPSYPCQYCKRLYTKGSLKNHISIKHALVHKKRMVPIKSPAKDIVLKVKQHILRRYLNKEPKSIQCDICHKKLSSAITLKQHHRLVHLMEKRECPLCHKKVRCLKAHIKYSHGEKRYACKECPMKFAKLYSFKIHKRLHSDVRPFPCNTCDASFKDKSSLDNHVRSIHKGERKYLCQVCSKKFFKRYHLDRHMRSHDPKPPPSTSSQMKQASKIENDVDQLNETQDIIEGSSSDQNHNPLKTLPCEFCSETFQNANGLEKHMNVHLTKKRFFCNDCDSGYYVKLALEVHILKNHTQFKIPTSSEQTSGICPICGKSFKRLYRHLRTHQRAAPSSVHKCKLCLKTLTSKIGLRRHQQRVHERERVKCTVCDKEVAYLKSHMYRLHKERSVPCSFCSQTFATKDILRAHLVSHSTERPFQCPQCDSHYKNKAALDRHTRRVHLGEKKFLCQICSKGFFQKDHFDRHLSSHTAEYKYKCEVCDKAMKTAVGLRTHMGQHEGVKNYDCTVCGRGFVSSTAYHSHKTTHTDEKKFPCRICGVMYKRTGHRNRHEVTAHGKIGKPLSEEGLKDESHDNSDDRREPESC